MATITIVNIEGTKKVEMKEYFNIQYPEKGDIFEVMGYEIYKGILIAIIRIEGKGFFDLPFFILPKDHQNRKMKIQEIKFIERENCPPKREYTITFVE